MKGSLAAGTTGANCREVGPILQIVQTALSSEQQLATVREVKNFLVGNEQVKHAALELSIVNDILIFLDAAAAATTDDGGVSGGGNRQYELSLLHGIGLLGILNSPPLPRGLAEVHLAPNGSRIMEHILRALEIPLFSASSGTIDRNRGSSSNGERLTATALRAVSSLFTSLVPLKTTTATTAVPIDVAKADDAATLTNTASTSTAAVAGMVNEEEEPQTLLGLRKASELILDQVVCATSTEKNCNRVSHFWSASLTALGLKALAVITRVDEVARSLVDAVVSTQAVLLAPIFPGKGSTVETVACGAHVQETRNLPPIMELLVNLSCADPHSIGTWLATCTPDWSRGGAFKGLEIELNNRDEKVKILAGLVLVNCFKSFRSTESRRGTDNTPTPSCPLSSPPSPLCSSHPGSIPLALDGVVMHRVLPLFFRTLRSWSILPSSIAHGRCGGPHGVDVGISSIHDGGGGGIDFFGQYGGRKSLSYRKSTNENDTFAAVCGGDAVTVMAAVTDAIEVISWQRQREAVAHGAVNSLVEFLVRARAEEMAMMAEPSPSGGIGSSSSSRNSQNRDEHSDSQNVEGEGALPDCAAASATGVESSRARDMRFIRAAVKTGLDALASLCARCELARERTIGLGFHMAIVHWLALASRENDGSGKNLKPGSRSSTTTTSSSIEGDGFEGRACGNSGGGSAIVLAALRLVRNLGRSSVSCSALVATKVYEILFDIIGPYDGACEGSGNNREEDVEEEKARKKKAESNESRGSGNEAKPGHTTSSAATTSITAAIAATVAAERRALAAACLANMAIEHETVKEAIAGSDECLRSICSSALDLSLDRKNARMASIGVLKSTCFLASMHVRIKVAHFLGGMDGMLGLLKGERGEEVLQGLYTLRNLLNGIPLWALCRSENETFLSPHDGRERGSRGQRYQLFAQTTAAVANGAAAAGRQPREVGGGGPNSITSSQLGVGGGVPPMQVPPAGWEEQRAAATTVAAEAGSNLARLLTSRRAMERGMLSNGIDLRRWAEQHGGRSSVGRGGSVGSRWGTSRPITATTANSNSNVNSVNSGNSNSNSNSNGNSNGNSNNANHFNANALSVTNSSLRQFRVEIDVALRGRAGGREGRGRAGRAGRGGRGGRGGGVRWGGDGGGGRGGDGGRGTSRPTATAATSGFRYRTFDGGRPEPMDVVCENSCTGGASEENASAKATSRLGVVGDLREEASSRTGMSFLRLMEAVLGALVGGAGGCDETSCAALRLLLVLSTADDSQKVALRTPRVLHAVVAFLTQDNSSTGNGTGSSTGCTRKHSGDKSSNGNNDSARVGDGRCLDTLPLSSDQLPQHQQRAQDQAKMMHTSAAASPTVAGAVHEAAAGCSYPSPGAICREGGIRNRPEEPSHQASSLTDSEAAEAAPASRAPLPPFVDADRVARLLLRELLPPSLCESGDTITAALEALPSIAFGSAGAPVAGASGTVGGMATAAVMMTGAAQAQRWSGRGGGQWRARSITPAGAWCSGLEFDGVGGGSRRPGGEE